jgi:20S proteasome alpha/beta subunit
VIVIATGEGPRGREHIVWDHELGPSTVWAPSSGEGLLMSLSVADIDMRGGRYRVKIAISVDEAVVLAAMAMRSLGSKDMVSRLNNAFVAIEEAESTRSVDDSDEQYDDRADVSDG